MCWFVSSCDPYCTQFEKFAAPEIARIPLEGVILHLKSMGIDDVARFPFPTPPDAPALVSALRLLTTLGALTAPNARVLAAATAAATAKLVQEHTQKMSTSSSNSSSNSSGQVTAWVDPKTAAASSVAATQRITPLGRTLAVLPVAPRFGKMLALGMIHVFCGLCWSFGADFLLLGIAS